MFDADPALLAQFRPEFAEHGGRRAHAAATDQLIQTFAVGVMPCRKNSSAHTSR
jgi:hypothetical protein